MRACVYTREATRILLKYAVSLRHAVIGGAEKTSRLPEVNESFSDGK